MNEQKLKFAMVVGSMALFNVAVVVGFQHQFKMLEAKAAKTPAQTNLASPNSQPAGTASKLQNAVAQSSSIQTESPIPKRKSAGPAPDLIRLVPPPPVTDYTGNPDYAPPVHHRAYHHARSRKPPEKSGLLSKLKVAAIIGDKTIIEVPGMIRLQRRWPATLSLGPGDKFEEISVVSIDGDRVTLEEHGKRMVLSLPTCR